MTDLTDLFVRTSRNSRNAFTLVELLVVIAVIGILVAILLPAVQAAREASRRIQCGNNLKQIGLGVHLYESNFKRYPPGAAWTQAPNGHRKGSILLSLLPYIEQENVYARFDFRQPNIDDSVFPGTTTKIATQLISTYQCPSDPQGQLYFGFARHNYAASRGPTAVFDNPSCSCNHPWQSLAIAPLDNAANFAGPFTRMGTTIAPAEISDGLTNTLFFGEVRPACSEHARNGWVASNNGNGYCTTIIPINFDSCQENSPDPCQRPCNWNTEVGFKSAHPGGTQFLLGDGSVRFFSETISHTAYQYLGGKSDGQVVSEP
jgi:prepilin-type N-terminal cleavage/methylation domain-containing protein